MCLFACLWLLEVGVGASACVCQCACMHLCIYDLFSCDGMGVGEGTYYKQECIVCFKERYMYVTKTMNWEGELGNCPRD